MSRDRAPRRDRRPARVATGSARRPRAPRAIDLNADVGEGFDESELMPELTSASVSCGAHAGDDETIRRTLALARACGVSVGAHPGFPDRDGFGRRVTTRDLARIAALVAEQIAHLAAIARESGMALDFVKPHGGLYNLAAAEPPAAEAIAVAVRDALPSAPVVLRAASPGLRAIAAAGLRAVGEGFVDRALLATGDLVPRGEPGATIDDPEQAARRALAIARDGAIAARGGERVRVPAETICVHGDGPCAAAIARRVRRALREAGIPVLAFARPR